MSTRAPTHRPSIPAKPASRQRTPWLMVFCLPFLAMMLMGAIPQARQLTRMELAHGVMTILPGTGSVSDSDLSNLFTDIDTTRGKDLRPVLEKGLMQGFPDGSFRPENPVHWDEWLHTWARLIAVLRPELLIEPSSSFVAWPQEELSLLAKAGIPLPEPVAQKRFSSRVSPAEFQTTLDATRQLLRIQMPGRAKGQAAAPEASDETPLERPTRPETDLQRQASIKESLAPADEPAAGFRLRGKLLDALTRKPVPEAQLIIDQKTITLSPEGEFHLDGLRRNQVVEVLITADGYQSISFKHRAGYKSFLQLLLKPYRASLRLNLVSAGTGEPVDGAEVALAGKELTSDWMGKVAFSGLNPGYQQVAISAPGFKPARTLIYVEEKASRRTIKLQPISD